MAASESSENVEETKPPAETLKKKSPRELLTMDLRSILLSTSDGLTERELAQDYRGYRAKNVPFKEMGYSSLGNLLESLSEVIVARRSEFGHVRYFSVYDESTAHIEKMVAEQKVSRVARIGAKPPASKSLANMSADAPEFLRPLIPRGSSIPPWQQNFNPMMVGPPEPNYPNFGPIPTPMFWMRAAPHQQFHPAMNMGYHGPPPGYGQHSLNQQFNWQIMMQGLLGQRIPFLQNPAYQQPYPMGPMYSNPNANPWFRPPPFPGGPVPFNGYPYPPHGAQWGASSDTPPGVKIESEQSSSFDLTNNSSDLTMPGSSSQPGLATGLERERAESDLRGENLTPNQMDRASVVTKMKRSHQESMEKGAATETREPGNWASWTPLSSQANADASTNRKENRLTPATSSAIGPSAIVKDFWSNPSSPIQTSEEVSHSIPRQLGASSGSAEDFSTTASDLNVTEAWSLGKDADARTSSVMSEEDDELRKEQKTLEIVAEFYRKLTQNKESYITTTEAEKKFAESGIFCETLEIMRIFWVKHKDFFIAAEVPKEKELVIKLYSEAEEENIVSISNQLSTLNQQDNSNQSPITPPIVRTLASPDSKDLLPTSPRLSSPLGARLKLIKRRISKQELPLSKEELESLSTDPNRRFVHVSIAQFNSVKEVWIILRDEMERLDKLMENMSRFYQDCAPQDKAYLRVKPTEITEGMVLAAEYEDFGWHRAEVKRISMDKKELEVMYVDYGSVGRVWSDSVRLLDAQFFDLPSQAIALTLPDSDSEEQAKIMEKRFVNLAAKSRDDSTKLWAFLIGTTEDGKMEAEFVLQTHSGNLCVTQSQEEQQQTQEELQKTYGGYLGDHKKAGEFDNWEEDIRAELDRAGAGSQPGSSRLSGGSPDFVPLDPSPLTKDKAELRVRVLEVQKMRLTGELNQLTETGGRGIEFVVDDLEKIDRTIQKLEQFIETQA